MMRWPAALVLWTVAGCGDDGSHDPSRHRDRDTRELVERKMQAELAEKVARDRQAKAVRVEGQLAVVSAEIDKVEATLAATEAELAGATDQAQRQVIARRLQALLGDLQSLRERMDDLTTGRDRPLPPADR